MTDDASSSADTDVRMRGFTRRATVSDALRWVDRQLQTLSAESVPLAQAAGRVLANDVVSQVAVPGFDRAMMDGYALQAADTLGASDYNTLTLKVIGQSLPAAPFQEKLGPGQAVRIMTGAPVPTGADAVLPVERTQIDGNQLHFSGEVPPQKHIGKRGEDITAGSKVLHSGRRLRPQDIGILSSIGVSEVAVTRLPRVRIVTTGDELLSPGSKPDGYKIVDSNGPMLSALVKRDGGVVVDDRIVPDDIPSIRQAMCDDVDVVLVSGGSSVGQEDHAPRLLAELGQLAIHGIAMRPSSPSGMGLLDHRIVFLLPGNPVSCLCSYDFFGGRAIRLLSGRGAKWPYRGRQLRLRRKIVSQVGRVDYARVAIVDEQVEPIAIAGASVLSSTSRADGFVVIPDDSEGYPPGAEVEVFLYD